MLTRLFAIAAMPLALAACSTVRSLPLIPDGDSDTVQVSNDRIALHGWRLVGDDILVVRVPSNGCTQKTDLSLDVRQRRGEFQVTIGRIREDYCRMLDPDGVEIPFGFEEFGARPGAAVTVMNPILED
ncbi:hypothetical protein V0U79_07280 [Hyphobacterium sp. HN65]|uniref:Lipoprotein n=1 Tax=Hyphobacterium lacteum TaxID=3116575 RepID=A0ABU7LRE6_9PROT|nr:hypothetical protein [Hyphobacterium sp. HN65]MEE2526164.1 hypothetical protein [Hyphobacterium sp. HN65]